MLTQTGVSSRAIPVTRYTAFPDRPSGVQGGAPASTPYSDPQGCGHHKAGEGTRVGSALGLDFLAERAGWSATTTSGDMTLVWSMVLARELPACPSDSTWKLDPSTDRIREPAPPGLCPVRNRTVFGLVCTGRASGRNRDGSWTHLFNQFRLLRTTALRALRPR
jgi:hypothetical protein